MKYALGIEYDGTSFCGWARCDQFVTVQGTLEKALSEIAASEIKTVCAGRTDSGVHAFGQVIHFDTEVVRPARAWVIGTNTHLPDSVAVVWATAIDDDFHARFSAQRRQYRYVIHNHQVRSAILNNRVTWEYRTLDADLMHREAQSLKGKHDFSSYRTIKCQAHSPVRTIHDISVTRFDDMIHIDVIANAFLHHMVRNIAGVLMAVGKGDKPAGWAKEVLEYKDRTKGGKTAPASGLYFMKAYYPDHFNLPEKTVPDRIW